MIAAVDRRPRAWNVDATDVLHRPVGLGRRTNELASSLAENRRFTFLGTRTEHLLGYPSRRWLEPEFWMEHVHPDDREWALRMCELPTPEPAERHREYRMIAADGSTAWMRNVATIVVERNGAIRSCGQRDEHHTGHHLGQRSLEFSAVRSPPRTSLTVPTR